MKRKVVQFRIRIVQEGGGEKVMRAIRDVLGAEIYTYLKKVDDEKIREVGTSSDRWVVGDFVKW